MQYNIALRSEVDNVKISEIIANHSFVKDKNK